MTPGLRNLGTFLRLPASRHILRREVNRTVSRFVALFFLVSAAIDMTHPCAEKLEAAGLLPDHAVLASSFVDVGKDRTSEGSARFSPAADPSNREPDEPCSDDDCFCCNGKVLTRAANSEFRPLEQIYPLASGNPVLTLEGAFRRADIHPPPRAGCLRAGLEQSFEHCLSRSEEILLAGLLSPPRGLPAAAV